MSDILVEVWDLSEESDIVIYKFRLYSICYLAEVELSSKKLLVLRDFFQYLDGEVENVFLVGEFEYNVARALLIENDLIIWGGTSG